MKGKLKIVIQFAEPHKFKFIILFLCIIITTFIGTFYPYIFGRLVDEVFYGKNMSVFLSIVLVYGVVYLFNQVMHLILNLSWASLMTKFLFDIRTAILNKVLSYKGQKLTRIYSGDVIARMDKDTEQFMDFIHNNMFYTIGDVFYLVFMGCFIWYINIWIALFIIVLTPIIVYVSRYFSKKAKKCYDEIAKKNGLLSSWLFEIIKGMQDIKLLNASKNILSDYIGKIIKITRIQIKSDRVEVLSERVNSGISTLAQMILYIISALFIINGHLTVGGFTACITYFGQCITIFNNLNNTNVNISANMVSIERVISVLSEESENYNESAPSIEIQNGNISFSNVWFAYNKDMDILKGISLDIAPGEKVSLVGHSGTGKTTIANLIYKLYEIDDGKICIDGVNINDFNLHNLREQIGIVHQESIFFDGTVRFNLCLNNSKDNDWQLWQVLKMSHLYDFVKSLPNGLDTVIGTEGITFSGGQKQRLAIARIFIKNPKILIFDEATSSLDSEAESVIKSSWDDLCKGRTIIIIAHRLSTILCSDKVAVVKDGQIVGFDSHSNLLKSCDAYIKLFTEQYRSEFGN